MRAFGESVWGSVLDRIVEICLTASAVIGIAIRSHFSWRRIVSGQQEPIAIGLTAIGLLVIWHAFRSAYAVSMEIREEHRGYGFSASSKPIALPRIRLYGIAVLLACLMLTISYLSWMRVPREQAVAEAPRVAAPADDQKVLQAIQTLQNEIQGEKAQSHWTPKPIFREDASPYPYKDIPDVQLSEWTVEEINKVDEMIRSIESEPYSNPLTPSHIFASKFQQCCTQDIKDLRAELLRRLGPASKDDEETALWTSMFPEDMPSPVPIHFPNSISISTVGFYLPYLNKMAVDTKHLEIPRRKPELLNFSEDTVPPDNEKLPCNIEITIRQPKREVNVGYLVFQLNTGPTSESYESSDPAASYFESPEVTNPEALEYAKTFPGVSEIAAVATTPMAKGLPLHVWARGTKPLHFVKVVLFDD